MLEEEKLEIKEEELAIVFATALLVSGLVKLSLTEGKVIQQKGALLYHTATALAEGYLREKEPKPDAKPSKPSESDYVPISYDGEGIGDQ